MARLSGGRIIRWRRQEITTMECLVKGPVVEVLVSSNNIIESIEAIITSEQHIQRKRRITINRGKKKKKRIVEVITKKKPRSYKKNHKC